MNWNLPHTGVNTFQLFFVPLWPLLALRAILGTRSGRVPKLSGVLAILIWLTATISIALPDSTSLMANKLGINRGADLVFYLAILAGAWTAFYFYGRYRRLENLVTAVIRRHAVEGARKGAYSKIDA